MGAVVKSYMRKGFLIYEENFLFFFISVSQKSYRFKPYGMHAWLQNVLDVKT